MSRTKHGLIAPRFASNYVENSIAYEGAVLWNAIDRSNGSILDCSDKIFFSEKGRYKCFTFSDFDFNVLPRQTINNRSENFLYFLCLFYD